MKYNILYTVYRSSAILYKKRGSKYCDGVCSMNMHYSIMNGSKCS